MLEYELQKKSSLDGTRADGGEGGRVQQAETRHFTSHVCRSMDNSHCYSRIAIVSHGLVIAVARPSLTVLQILELPPVFVNVEACTTTPIHWLFSRLLLDSQLNSLNSHVCVEPNEYS